MKAHLVAVFNIKPIDTFLFEFSPALQNKVLGFIAVVDRIKSNDYSKRNEGISSRIISNSIGSE